MKILKVVGGVVAVFAVLYVFIAPIGPAPGFFIGGNATAAPSQWPDTSGVHEITLKVPGGLPRVVIIWVIEYDNNLYVVGSKGSGWVDRIGAGSPVEMRLEDNTYSLTATTVSTGWEPIMQAYVEKYQPDYPEIVAGFPAIEDAAGSIGVFRLDR
ncbi:MAG: hypothetical protein AAF541_03120 [Pseudomonadota bacterium]